LWIFPHFTPDIFESRAGEAAELPPPRLANPVSIAWMRKTVSDQYTAAANIELSEKGKHTITPPPPKTSALDKGPNWEARLASQLRTNHWRSGVYLKRIRKRTHAGCWFCDDMYLGDESGPPKMTRIHVLLRCPALEDARREAWVDNTTGAFTRPSSIGALLGNPRWEKRLLKFLSISGVCKLGPDKVDDEIRRITRYDEWHNLADDAESQDHGDTTLHDSTVMRATIVVRSRH
jgi:hypothetical protein